MSRFNRDAFLNGISGALTGLLIVGAIGTLFYLIYCGIYQRGENAGWKCGYDAAQVYHTTGDLNVITGECK